MVIDRIELLRKKAEYFLNKDIKAFIIDSNNDYFFCYILVVGEDHLYVQHFEGKKKHEKERILWFDIIKFDEYRGEL